MPNIKSEPEVPLIINFDRIWRFVPMNRPQKEFLKTLLFSFFPVFFRRWAVYQNWQHARCFVKGSFSWSKGFRSAITMDKAFQQPPIELPIIQLPKTALVIHAFYPEILCELLELLESAFIPEPKLFVTCQHGHEAICHEILKKRGLPYKLLAVNNRGRDILPFLTMAPFALDENFEIILKLHTKKSMHLKRNLEWRNDLYSKLISGDSPSRLLALFKQYPHLGLIAPAGHIQPMSLYYGANAARLKELCIRMGVEEDRLRDYIFIAGSMFAIRAKALEPLLSLGLKECDFEPESRQTDGTMAHALERIFTSALVVNDMTLCDTESYSGHPRLSVSRNYKFTL